MTDMSGRMRPEAADGLSPPDDSLTAPTEVDSAPLDKAGTFDPGRRRRTTTGSPFGPSPGQSGTPDPDADPLEDPRAQLLGRLLGRFRVVEHIGGGGLGEVYRAEQELLGRDAVIKVMRRDRPFTRTRAERFLREARLAARLDHPYAAHIYAFGAEPDGLLWLAMELVRGRTLRRLVVDSGPMPLEHFAPLAAALCEVVHAAHELGIVHRDLKPSNVMVVSSAGRLLPKLLDFGVAKALDDRPHIPNTSASSFPTARPIHRRSPSANPDVADGGRPDTADPAPDDDEAGARAAAAPGRAAARARTDTTELTRNDQLLGSPRYMAPEQWTAPGAVDRRADIYALGALFYFALTGSPPFSGATVSDVARAHAEDPPPPLELAGPAEPAVARALEEVLGRALAKRPEGRFSTALELGHALIAAAGAAAAPPRLDPSVAERWIEEAPEPLARLLVSLAAGQTLTEADAAARTAVEVLVRWLAVVALAGARAARARPPDRARELGRALLRRGLSTAEWLELGAVLAPAALETVPGGRALADPVARAALAQLAAPREALPSGPALRARLADDLTGLAAALDALAAAGLLDARVIAADAAGAVAGGVAVDGDSGAGAVDLSGVHRLARAHGSLWGPAPAPGEVALVGLAGAARLPLSPLCTYAPAHPGGEPELFVLAGGARGPCLRALPSGAELLAPDALRAVTEALDLSADTLSPAAGDEAPYPGLAPFSAADAGRFVGRERETDAFKNLLRARRLVALVGASGAGKSSFLSAGVLADLPPGWRAAKLRPGADPVRALCAAAGLPISPDAPASAVAAALIEQARADSSPRGDGADAGALVVAVDQLEELFALCPDPGLRERFAAILVEAADRGAGLVRVVLCLRDDFLARAESLAALRGRLSTSLMLLVTPAPEELRRVVIEPARRAGVRLEDEAVVDEMVAATCERPGGLALLAFTARAWWDRRDAGARLMRTDAYRELGGVAGALARHAEALYAALGAEARRATREVVRHLVTAAGTRASLPEADLVRLAGPGGHEAVRALVAGRLLVARDDVSSPEGGAVELAHEALIDAWPLLRRIREEDAKGAALRDDLRAAARTWRQHGMRPDQLWRGRALAELERFRARADVRLTEIEESFADRSRALGRRTRRRRRLAVLAAALAAVASVAALAVAAREARQSEGQAQVMARQAVDDQARAHHQLAEMWLREGRRESARGSALRALAYLEAAYGQIDGPGLRFALARSMASIDAERAVLRGRGSAVRELNWSPDGRLLATTDDNDAFTLWQIQGRRPRRLARLRRIGTEPDGRDASSPRREEGVGWAPMTDEQRRDAPQIGRQATGGSGAVVLGTLPEDTGMVAGFGDGGRVIGFEAKDGFTIRSADNLARIGQVPRGPGNPGDMGGHFTTDGRHILTWRYAGSVSLCQADGSGCKAVNLGAPLDFISADKAGRRVAAALKGGGVAIIDTSTGTVRRLLAPGAELSDLDVDDTGAHVAVAGTGGTTTLFDAATGERLRTLRGHSGPHTVSLSHDGRLVATGGSDHTAKLWSVDSGRLIATMTEHRGPVSQVEFAPGDRRLATASADGTIRVYATDGALLATYEGHAADVLDVAWSPDGNWLASAGAEGVVKIWPGHEPEARELVKSAGDVVRAVRCGPALAVAELRRVTLYDMASGRPLAHAQVTDPIFSLACSPKGDRIAVGTEHGGVLLDGRGRRIAVLATVEPAPMPDAAFSRDGQLLASIHWDGTVRLWHGRTGKPGLIIHGDPMDDAYPASIAIDPSGSEVLVGDSSGTVSAWKVTDGSLARRARPHRSVVRKLSLSPDGRLLAVAASDRSVSLVRADDLSVQRTIEEHSAVVRSLDWSADSALLVTGSQDPSASVWDVASGALVGEVRPGGGGVTGVALSRGRIVAVSESGRVMSFPAGREKRSPAAIRAILACRLPYRLGERGLERITPGEDCVAGSSR